MEMSGNWQEIQSKYIRIIVTYTSGSICGRGSEEKRMRIPLQAELYILVDY